MKSGKCPKCGSGDIYVSSPKLSLGSASTGHSIFMKRGMVLNKMALLRHYACASCKYTESYIADDKSMKYIKEEWQAMNQKSKRKRKNDEG
jgi:predicted nucleic-acid-binding Zn-ribbon protein